MLEKRAALISLSRQRPPPTPPNDPPWKNVFTDISLYDHFELPEHIFGNCHFGNVHEENWHLCTALLVPLKWRTLHPCTLVALFSEMAEGLEKA